ncbi:hypothetical protein HHL16_19435 [Pseudoflavitalea sp. G-6-1-2]|uniref:hypothetical protein n=1 Tax=Pseudoflavitalea sp. G-6-1-2 TaxID=2728841 RepID=UPI00146C0018|nr:hypothetical protein [Pseudoflavitalea sp. G-6-1-2]NML23060.1 hypothetical protein [Pseudoflavitalea sp. G-6-1-2]
MKRILPLLAVIALTASCNRYQYLSFDSKHINKNDQKDFVVDTDSLKIIYSFTGVNAPVNIRIYNKLDQPLWVNWRRSALVINQRAISYNGSLTSMPDIVAAARTGDPEPVALSDEHNNDDLPAAETSYTNQKGELIPPHSYISRSPMGLTNDFFNELPKSAFRVTSRIMYDGTVAHVKEAEFSEENSPLRFRNYLSIVGEDSAAKPIVYQHTFYVGQLIRTGIGPGQFDAGQAWVKKETGLGKGMATGFGIVAEAAIVGAADALTEKMTGRPVIRYYPYDKP